MWSPLGILLFLVPLALFTLAYRFTREFTFSNFIYRFHSKYIGDRIFQLQDNERTPAHDPLNRENGDYSPSPDRVLWGHHFSSIAGAAPIVGPSIAVYYGWLPALLWCVFGTIFIGSVHDMGALVISARNGGHTVADLTGKIISRRARTLFLLVTYFLCWIILATFARIIGKLFAGFPASVIPINVEIVLALLLGWVIQKKKITRFFWVSVVFLLILYLFVWIGAYIEHVADDPVVKMKGLDSETEVDIWVLLLMVYAVVASVLPVSVLLRPRDVLNSHQLIVGIVLIVSGLIIGGPTVDAPALNQTIDPDAPPIFPFLFVTIACGAVSGFHGLVASATTSKQLDKMRSARAVGYAACLGEGLQASLTVVVCVCGLKFDNHYGTWLVATKSGTSNFVDGASSFLLSLGVPTWIGQPLVAVIVVSFAATSLDTAMRIQRTIVNEVGGGLLKYGSSYRSLPYRIGRTLSNKYFGALIAVGPAMWLAMGDSLGELWALFGSTNQLVAAVTLTAICVELYRDGSKWRDLISIGGITSPIFMFCVCSTALVYELTGWFTTGGIGGHFLSIVVGLIILIVILLIVMEIVLLVYVFRRRKGMGQSVRGSGHRIYDKFRSSAGESDLIEAQVGVLEEEYTIL